MRLGRFTDLAFRIKDRSLVGKEGTKWNEGGSRRERMQLSVCSKVVKDALRANWTRRRVACACPPLLRRGSLAYKNTLSHSRWGISWRATFAPLNEGLLLLLLLLLRRCSTLVSLQTWLKQWALEAAKGVIFDWFGIVNQLDMCAAALKSLPAENCCNQSRGPYWNSTSRKLSVPSGKNYFAVLLHGMGWERSWGAKSASWGGEAWLEPSL